MPPISPILPASKYFVIPFENVPENPTYTVWYATLNATWSKERPIVENGTTPPMVVGATTEAKLPDGAVLVGSTRKDPLPPPPPPPRVMADYHKSFDAWMSRIRDEDE